MHDSCTGVAAEWQGDASKEEALRGSRGAPEISALHVSMHSGATTAAFKFVAHAVLLI